MVRMFWSGKVTYKLNLKMSFYFESSQNLRKSSPYFDFSHKKIISMNL